LDDVLIGILTLLVGLLFCFRGYLAMRVVIPIWGGFTGFYLGAGLVDSFSSDGFLGSALGWIVGLAVAFVFALLAYLYYEISVVIAMGAIGFALGSTLMVALGVTWSWVIVLVGLAVGVLLGIVALVGDLPMVLLTVLSALAGASVATMGLMLIFGTVSLSDFDSAATTQTLNDDWWWMAIYVGLVIVGIIAQVRSTARLAASLRDSWGESGGRYMRTASS
jgi:hypothetical protein